MKKLLSCFLVAGLAMSACSGMPMVSASAEEADSPRIVGYLPDWTYSAYKTIDFSKLTHLNIAFCNPDTEGNLSCWIPDSEFHQIVEVAHENEVKVMAALGGGGGCDGYAPLLETSQEIADFNEKIMAFCEKYSLDGIDLDIEKGRGDVVWKNYAEWVDTLRVLCDDRGYELSTATAQWVAGDVSPETFSKFDFINVMAYDNDSSPTTHAGMDFTYASMNFFHEQKQIPKEKLVLGVPFYGRGYDANGKLDWNSYVPIKDLFAENILCYEMDEYNGIAYNGAETMAEKCRYARDYGGIMIWELSQDASGEYSMLKLIHDTLNPKPLTGDVNADGSLTIADLVLLQKWLLTLPDATLPNPAAADMNGDRILSTADLSLMKHELLGCVTEYVKPEVEAVYSTRYYPIEAIPLYYGPDLSYGIITTIPKDATLREIGYNQACDNWMCITYEEQTGWVRVNDEDGNATVWAEALAKKPVIYLYPEAETDVHITLELTESELSTTYPKYRNGWDVTAYPDGTLQNKADGSHHRYLFWDSVNCRTRFDYSKGFCVAGEDTERFLKEKLTESGLTESEMNEFIVYWLPLMEHNAYNLVTFQEEAYTNSAKLNITPTPDSLLRVFMVYVPLDAPVDIAPQTFKPFERNGFTVVEWGGTVIK